MDARILIAVTVLVILLLWIILYGGVIEPIRSMLIGVLALGLLIVILRLLGLL